MNAPVALIVEGDATTDGRRVLRGATTWKSPPLPIIADGRQWGQIVEIGRFGDVIAVRTDPSVPLGFCLTADTTDVDIEHVRASRWRRYVALLRHRPVYGTMVFHRLRVVGAHLSPSTAWPWPGRP